MKGMTNALPVLIDASTLATKSDISDMETKTNANATFATKTALTTLQNSVGDAFSQVAVGSDGKSLDFTALDGQVNNVVLPSSGASIGFEKLTYGTPYVISGVDNTIIPNLNVDSTKLKLGTTFIVYFYVPYTDYVALITIDEFTDATNFQTIGVANGHSAKFNYSSVDKFYAMNLGDIGTTSTIYNIFVLY